MDGEAMNDAVYKRNQLVEERFNVVITQIPYDKSTFAQAFKNSVLAADDAYDVYVDTYEKVMQSGYEYGLEVSSLPYVDLSQSWWDTILLRRAHWVAKLMVCLETLTSLTIKPHIVCFSTRI